MTPEFTDLGDGYHAVPFEAVTLNGIFLPQLLESSQVKASTDWAVIGPDLRALEGENDRPYRYPSLEAARADVATLKSILKREEDGSN